MDIQMQMTLSSSGCASTQRKSLSARTLQADLRDSQSASCLLRAAFGVRQRSLLQSTAGQRVLAAGFRQSLSKKYHKKVEW